MPVHHEDASDPQRAKIIDVDVNEPGAPAGDADDTGPPPRTFRERHTLKVMGVVMVVALASVIIAQKGW